MKSVVSNPNEKTLRATDMLVFNYVKTIKQAQIPQGLIEKDDSQSQHYISRKRIITRTGVSNGEPR